MHTGQQKTIWSLLWVHALSHMWVSGYVMLILRQINCLDRVRNVLDLKQYVLYEMSAMQIQETYKGNSLRKSCHNNCCCFGFIWGQILSRDQLHLHSNFWDWKREFSSQQSKSFDTLVFATHQHFSWWFRRKLHDNISKVQNKEKMSHRILWSAAFSNVPVHHDRDSHFQKFPRPMHVRTTFLIGNLFTNLGAMIYGKINIIVVKLVDSTARYIRSGTPKDMILVPFNSERPRRSVGA